MRFANRLEFKEKTHEVSMTAQRLVQRMKKDSIHSGRRPTGLCGAALLIAARMHEFNRTINDILEIVRIHESTLKKRLFEFGQTPSSGLTLDEFMTIDLEAEQDPPAFLAARQRDKERLKKSTTTETVAEFTKLQKLIDEQLEKDLKGRLKNILPGVRINEKDIDDNDVNDMIDNESGLSADIVNEADAGAANAEEKELLPDTTAIYERPDVSIVHEKDPLESSLDVDPMDDIDDAEIDNYILQPEDVARKTDVWNKLNADYLEKAKLRQEKLSKEPEKKKRKVARKSQIPPSNTAGEAIAKMLQEKKISSKINYDVLKTLDQSAEEATTSKVESEESQIIDVDSKLLESSFLFSGSTSKKRTIENTSSSKNRPLLTSGKRQKVEAGLQIGDYDTRSAVAEIDGNEIGTKQSEQKISAVESTDTDDYDDDEESVDEPTSIAKLMSKVSEDEEDYYD